MAIAEVCVKSHASVSNWSRRPLSVAPFAVSAAVASSSLRADSFFS